MYVKITNGTVDTYPYNIGQLRRDNPNTSFPKQIPEEMLNSYGVYRVVFSETPNYDARTQNVIQNSQPTLINFVWTLGYTILNKTVEEVQQYSDYISSQVRSDRNRLLAESDWTQIADAPINKSTWATYRQALRDITSQAGFPHNIVWPTKPE